MAGYTRQDTANNIANGNVIDADDFDAEYNAIESGFNASTGHKHDGSAGEGAPITKVGPSQDLIVSPSTVLPKTPNTLDLGSNAAKFKDGYFDGTVVTDALTVTAGSTLSGNVTVGGTLGVTGATTLSSTADITGNTTVGGTLGVTGASTLDSAAVTNNATVGGTLGVTGNTTVGGTLGVTGASTLDSAAVTNNATVGGTLGVTGNSTFSGTLGVTSNTTVGGDLDVTGNTTLSGTLGITGATTFSGDVNVGSDTIEEYVQDTVGGMVAGNTETGLSVTYDDTNGKLDFALTKDPVITLTGDVTGTGTMTNLGDVSIATTVAANQVALGTDTTGNYVAGATAGTGVSISGTAGEGWSPTISIGQAVGTTSNVTFNTVTASLTGNASSASTAAALTGDVTRSGDFTVDASGNIVLDADNNGGISNFQFKNGTGGGTFNMAFDNSENMVFSGAQAFSISSGQDLILDADGGQIYFRSGNVTRGYLDVQTANTLDFHAGSSATENLKVTTSGVNVVQGLRVGDTATPTDNTIEATGDIKSGGDIKLTGGAQEWSFDVQDTSNILVVRYNGNGLFRIDTNGNVTAKGDITAYGTF